MGVIRWFGSQADIICREITCLLAFSDGTQDTAGS